MTNMGFLVEQGDVYRLLSACFYEPDRQLFMEEKLCENLKRLIETTCPDGAAAAEKMAQALRDSTQNDLALEHAALFVGPFALLAPPYGSVYLEKGKRLMGETTMEIKTLYAETGLELDFQEPPDHIAFELEFMHYLCMLQVKAAEKGSAEDVDNFAVKQNNFLMKFMSPWIPSFCKDIRNNTDNGFYYHLADCLQSVIEHLSTSEALSSTPHSFSESTDNVCRTSA